MRLVAAAVCPHPPLIIPAAAGGAAAELDDLRSACITAIDRLFAAGANAIMLIGTDAEDEMFAPPLVAVFTDFGPMKLASVGVGGHLESRKLRLPLSLGIGVWLLDYYKDVAGIANKAWLDTAFSGLAVAADKPARACLAVGAGVIGQGALTEDIQLGLLVMGDGTAKRTEKAPGDFDPRAEAYDRQVARALAKADAGALGRLDPVRSDDLMVGGRAAWQTLAGAVRHDQGRWSGDLLYDAAPYGVGYFVASWLRR